MVGPKRPSPRKRVARRSPAADPGAAPRPAARNASQPGREPCNGAWRSAFLAELAATSNVTAAAAAAGVQISRPYKLKRIDPAFAREWHAALLDGYDNLELELLHRLRFGEPKDAELKFDNATALRLLAQHRETVVREKAIREHEDVTQIRATIDARLARLRVKLAEHRAAAQAEAAHPAPVGEVDNA